LEKGDEPKSRRPDPVVYRAFDLDLIQREYGLYRAADLFLEDRWTLEIVAQERRRWEAEIDNYRSQWMKQESKMEFRLYLNFVPELQEYF